MDTNGQTYYVKLGEDGLPTGIFVTSHEYWDDSFLVGIDERWATIYATNEDDLQEKMRTFQVREEGGATQ